LSHWKKALSGHRPSCGMRRTFSNLFYVCGKIHARRSLFRVYCFQKSCNLEIENMNEQNAVKELPACPVETTLTLIGDKWKVLILRDLLPGTKRFGELKKSLGSVSQKVLTAQLRDMEECGLIERKVYAEVPPRVEYTLTETGYSLKPILDAMQRWGEQYKVKLNL
jgi:DNA-binding HxlR family transcriptional regulator